MSDLEIRQEQPGDESAIARIVEAAFENHPHSDGSEPRIVSALRESDDLTISLVAFCEKIVGHVAFSPVRINGVRDGWYGLGPVSVLPARQNEGIGAALVRDGLQRLAAIGAAGCVVLGEPAYYARFGFAHDPHMVLPGVPPRYFQRLVIAGDVPRGEVAYAPAFS